MNSKTVLTAGIGAIVALGLTMGTAAFARNTGQMNTGMMGQQTTTMHGSAGTMGTMHGQANSQMQQHGTMHLATANQKAGNSFCHTEKVARLVPKGKKKK